MSNLEARIRQIIKLQGPITVSQYMMLALGDPKDGYYQTKKPFGREGDFITAPEVSQMFGELIGIWVINSWISLKQPKDFILCEMGPGRGTLMDDVLRTIKKLAPDCLNAAEVNLIETSQRLIEEQKTKLTHHQLTIKWFSAFSNIQNKPIILFANELLDALPINQFVKLDSKWHERLITIGHDDTFAFVLGGNQLDDHALPAKYHSLPDESIFEFSPIRNHLVEEIAQYIAKNRGTGLIIDYGSDGLPYGDTLQALSHHQYKNIFEAPGHHDLTSHVDFSSLKVIAEQQDCQTAILQQGEFLIRMGLLERAGQLGHGKTVDVQNDIETQVNRLAAPDQMGKLFKIFALSDKTTDIDPVFYNNTL